MAIKVTGTTVINDSRNIENITTINGTAWATVVSNASAGSEVTVNELTDVTLGTLTTGEVLQYNGSAWVNTGLDFTDIASTLANAQVVASNVTQHQAALSITESQISDLGTYETADSTILKDADIGVTVQAQGNYEAADSTILKDADIGVNVEAYDSTILKDADIGVNVQAFGSYEAADSTILKDADIGVNVEAYDATILKDADIGVNVEAYDATILKDADIGVNVEAFDATILKDADIGVNVEAYDATIVKDADIGVNVQAYDANLVSDANYVATDENFTTADHAKLDGIETGATADQTKADIEGLGIAYSSLSAVPTTLAGYGITDASTTVQMNTSISNAVGNLINTAPAALDTLNELAASLGDDADFAGTMTTALAGKEPADATILKDADIGVNVLAYDANVVSDANYVATDENFTTADHTKLDGIEALADVTDVTNVTAAGALMDSEVTNLAAVKSFDPADYQAAGSYETADATILKDADIGVNVMAYDATMLVDADIGVNVLAYDANVVSDATYVATANDFTTVLKNKLDGIEASATADQTGAEIKALYEAEANAYTNALNTKLAGIETGATADQTKADIEALGILFSSLTSTPSTIAGYGISDAYTSTQVDGAIDTAIGDLIDSAPTALDTLNELAASLGDDSDFAGTMTTNLATKLNKSGGALTGAVTTTSTFDGRNVSTDGTKLDTIATNADVTPAWVPSSDPSYLTSYTVTEGDVTGHQAALSITESQISDLGSYLTSVPAQSFSSLTGKPTTIAGYGITDTFFDGAYGSLSGTPTIPTNNNQLTNGAGYITSYTDTNTTYSGGDGITLSGTTFNIDDDLRGHTSKIGQDTNDYITVESNVIDFRLDGNLDMRLENDGDLHVDGNVVAYSGTTSDERLKKDIVKIDNAMDKVAQLNGYTFEYLNDGKKSAGIIAQEVEKVLPSAITEMKLPLKSNDDKEYKVVQYDQLTGLLIEAIKELKAEIEVLKGK
jgi:NDP-sugar pyrophosphorylase family protein